jgi:N-acetylmuramoyl-L-alanine amidase
MLLWLSAVLLIGGAAASAILLAVGHAPPTPQYRVAAAKPARVRVAAVGGGEASAVAATTGAAKAVDPSFFSRGACLAFDPAVPARHLTVFLDAGHGGPDPGAVGRTESGRTIHEADETLAVELDAMALLRAGGLRVVVSRTRDSTVLRLRPGEMSGRVMTVGGSHADLLARVACANDARADVLVGIYFDAGASGNAGCVTGYDAVRPFAAKNLRLAKLLQTDVLGAMNARGWGIPDGGVRSDVGLGSALTSTALSYGHLVLLGPADRGYVPAPSRMPGALIEPLFITDPFEGSIAASAGGQKVIAGAIAKAVEQYFAHGT